MSKTTVLESGSQMSPGEELSMKVDLEIKNPSSDYLNLTMARSCAVENFYLWPFSWQTDCSIGEGKVNRAVSCVLTSRLVVFHLQPLEIGPSGS